MSLYRNVQPLLSVTSAIATAQTGTAQTIIPQEGDGVADHQQSWKVFFDLTQAGGATSPTSQAHLQTSHDGTNWVTVASCTQLTADGAVHELKDVAALGPHVRAVSALGGGGLPNHTVVVKLASNAPFRLVTGT